jgi:hypothetical protein
MERIDWTYAVSVAATLTLSGGRDLHPSVRDVRRWVPSAVKRVDLGVGKAHRAFARDVGSPDCRSRGGRLAHCQVARPPQLAVPMPPAQSAAGRQRRACRTPLQTNRGSMSESLTSSLH